jgi:hypothetical protein
MKEGSRLIEGKYRGISTVTNFDGIDINVEEVILILEIEKIYNTPNTYFLFYRLSTGVEFKTLGNIIDGKLVNIVSSSVYNYFNLIDDKLVHNFFGIQNNKQISGTGILERYC